MRFQIGGVIFLSLFLFLPTAQASSGNDCVHCGVNGGELLDSGPSLTELGEQLACSAFMTGRFDIIREEAQKVGGVAQYYALLKDVSCGRARMPLYYEYIRRLPPAHHTNEMFSQLEQVDAEVIEYILNRPVPGRRQETVIDLLDRHIEVSERTPGHVNTWSREVRRRYVERGAKRYEDLTEEEISRYE